MRNKRDRKLTDTLNVRIPHALKMQLKEQASRVDLNVSEYVIEVLTEIVRNSNR